MRKIVSFGLAAVIALSLSWAAAAENLGISVQGGDYNILDITQEGSDNLAFVLQLGLENEANVEQTVKS